MGGGNVADLEIFDVSKLICKHNVQKEAQCRPYQRAVADIRSWNK
jgi:hypothetical protein